MDLIWRNSSSKKDTSYVHVTNLIAVVASLWHRFSLLSFLAYQVHGIIRRSSSFNTGRIDHIYRDRHETGVKLFLHYGDLCDATNLITIISKVKPTEIYNLGAMSHVKASDLKGNINIFLSFEK